MAGSLILAVLVEITLLRILARAGIYMFRAGAPAWLGRLYQSLVFLGNVSLYFAGLLATLLTALLAYMLWCQPALLKRVLAIHALVVLGLSGVLSFVTPPPAWSLLYLSLSASLVSTAVAILWTGGGPLEKIRDLDLLGLAALALGLSWMCAYYAKATPLLNRLGVVFPGAPTRVLLLGEALAGLSILLVFLASRRVSRREGIIRGLIAAVPVFPLLAMYAIKPQMLPLIAIWAFGLGLYLPLPVYAIGLWLLILTVWRFLTAGQKQLSAGLLLILLSHRMLPLIYFNLMLAAGFLSMVVKLDSHPRALSSTDTRQTHRTI